MTPDDIAKLADVDSRSKSNTHRINKLEESTQALNELTTSLKVMVTKQDNIAEKVDCLDSKISNLESKPAKRWENVVEKAIGLLIAGFVGFCFSQIGM